MLRLGRKFVRTIAGDSSDRRAHERHATKIDTICRRVSEADEIPARILDVSLGGIKIAVSRLMREGTMLRVDLPKAAGPATTILACVTHVHQAGRAEWEVGCSFSLELSDDEVRAFGGHKARTTTGDQRAWVRQPARGTIDFRPLPGHDGPPDTAEIVNLSPTGVGLIVESPLEPGSALTVSLKRHDDQPDQPVLAVVVYQTEREDGMWAAGCQFIRQLSQTELDELLWPSAF
jgi:PilZ domain